MPRKAVHFASLLLHAVSICVLAATLLPVPWYSFEHAGISFTFSIFSCIDCEAPFSHISPDCFDTVYCSDDATSGLCDLAPDLQQAADFYFYSACIALLFHILNIERLLSLHRERDYGHPKAMAALIPLPLIATAIGVGGWFGTVKPKFTDSCGTTQGSETPCVSLKFGAYLALAGAVLTTAATATLLLAFCRRDKGLDKGVTGIGEGKIIAFTFRNWLLTKVGPVLLIGIIFIGVTFVMPWIKFEDSETSYKGDLLKMRDRLGAFGKSRYECMWGPACDGDNSAASKLYCTAFKRLSLVNTVYLGLECCTLLFLVLWMESFVYFILKREFGTPSLAYCWAPLTTLCHIAAVMFWFIRGGAKMGGDCEVEQGDTDITFCAETGASFTIWEGLCFFFATIFYELLYYRRRDGYVDCEVVTPEMPSKLNVTDTDMQEVPSFTQKAFETEAGMAPPPPSMLASKVTGLTVSSRMHTQQNGFPPSKSQSPFRPTLETLEEKSYCVSCDDE